MSVHIKAKSVLPALMAAMAASAVLAMSGLGAAAQTRTLTISWWGFNGDKLNQIIIAPFKARCGCEVVIETGNNADRLSKIKLRGGAGVDVAYFNDSFSQIGIREGLFQPVDRAKVPNLATAYEIARAPQGQFGPAYTIGRIGIIYNRARVSAPITAWSDLWKPEFKGRLSLPGISTTAGPSVVLLAGEKAGVDPHTNPVAAFKALAELKPNVVKNYSTGSELVNLFSTGEIVAAIAQDFTLAQIQRAVPTAEWAPLPDAFAALNTINIPRRAANVDLAHQFIDFVLDPAVQKALAENGVDAPVQPSVVLGPEQARQWTYGAAMVGGLRRIDHQKLNASRDGWTERWNEVFGM